MATGPQLTTKDLPRCLEEDSVVRLPWNLRLQTYQAPTPLK